MTERNAPQDLETLGARLAHENGSLKRSNRGLYESLRKLENAVREHALGECDCKSLDECLMKLYRRIPQNPRPTMKQRMAAFYKRERQRRAQGG